MKLRNLFFFNFLLNFILFLHNQQGISLSRDNKSLINKVLNKFYFTICYIFKNFLIILQLLEMLFFDNISKNVFC